jgi:hypothetical protein
VLNALFVILINLENPLVKWVSLKIQGILSTNVVPVLKDSLEMDSVVVLVLLENKELKISTLV